MATSKTIQKPRRDNRQQQLMEAAASWFRRVGYDETSMRDIAASAKMLPGSVYYHFSSKEELFFAVYRKGMEELIASVDKALSGLADPMARLEAACTAHLEMILNDRGFAGVVVRVIPLNDDNLRARVIGMRDNYEDIFRQLIAELPLASTTNRKYLRLALLGALNCCQIWYQKDQDDPAAISTQTLRQFFGRAY